MNEQVQSDPQLQTPQPDPSAASNQDRLGKIEAALVNLAESQKQLNQTAQEIMKSQPSREAVYLSELEQNKLSPQTDWNLMDNQQLVEILDKKRQQELSLMAAQFGQMLRVINPQWEGWKYNEALAGLMAQGASFEQAYGKVKQLAEAKTKDISEQTQEERVLKEVETRLAAIDQKRRALRASAAEKPGSSSTPGAKLSPKEQFNQDWENFVEEGKQIPEELTRGLR